MRKQKLVDEVRKLAARAALPQEPSLEYGQLMGLLRELLAANLPSHALDADGLQFDEYEQSWFVVLVVSGRLRDPNDNGPHYTLDKVVDVEATPESAASFVPKVVEAYKKLRERASRLGEVY